MKHLLLLLITALVFNSCACSEKKVHWEMEPPHPVSSDTPSTPSDNDLYPKSEGVLRLVHYNVGAFNKSGSSTVDMIADMLTELHADIISMNEVDSLTTRTGRVDQPEAVAGRLGGWGHMFAKAMDYQGGGYGLSILHRPDFKPLARPTLHIPREKAANPAPAASSNSRTSSSRRPTWTTGATKPAWKASASSPHTWTKPIPTSPSSSAATSTAFRRVPPSRP